MVTIVSLLHVEQEAPSHLNLETTDRSFLILIASLFPTTLMLCLGLLLLQDERIWLLGIVSILIGLCFLGMVLYFSPFKSEISISSTMLTITLNRHYWLGETTREKSWYFNDFTDVNFVLQGWRKQVEFKSNRRKVLLLDFGNNGEDAQRVLSFVKNQIKGYEPDANIIASTMQNPNDEPKNQQLLRNTQKMLNIFGIFSLISGALGLFTDSFSNNKISPVTIINIVTGVIYLACGYGAKRRSETALWIAILVVIGERLYWFIQARALSGNNNFSSFLTWLFAFLVISSLWNAIRSVRVTEEKSIPETSM